MNSPHEPEERSAAVRGSVSRSALKHAPQWGNNESRSLQIESAAAGLATAALRSKLPLGQVPGIRRAAAGLLLLASLCLPVSAADPATTASFEAVQKVFTQHCLDCHAAQDPEGNLVMETFETLMKGGESGAAIVPGKSAQSLLIRMIQGEVEKDGKKKIMPPGKRKKLEAAEISLIRSWIDGGAPAPVAAQAPRVLTVPKIVPQTPPRRPVHALAVDPKGKLFALGRFGEVQLFSAESHALVRTIGGHRGNVNALAFSPDGEEIVTAAGEAGLVGEIRRLQVRDGTLVRQIEAHTDAIYALAVSPDGKILATGSYDQKIILWNRESGEMLRTLIGHNGAIYSLAFRPDGKLLASGSADRTVKLWDVASGERRETLSQPLKPLYAVAFSPDGKRLLSGGVDNRLRVWEVSETAAETTNPLLYSKFAHEGAILAAVYSTDGKMIVSSAEDGTVKVWDAADLKEKVVLEKQPDWARALGFALENKVIVAGRVDGTVGYYNPASGDPVRPPKPELTSIEPRGVQRGIETTVQFLGKNLSGVTEVKSVEKKISATLAAVGSNDTVSVKLTPAADLARGAYEVSLVSSNGESGRVKVYVDDLPQFAEGRGTNHPPFLLERMPASYWGALDVIGDQDEVGFTPEANQTLVFDLQGRSIGSKANLLLTLLDETGREIARNAGFEGSTEPLLVYSFRAPGRYTARIEEQLLGASADHFYRLSVGSFPYITGCFPLSVETNSEREIELVGFNLSTNRQVRVKAGTAGEMDLPFDAALFRNRGTVKLMVGSLPEVLENEPNDLPAQANPVSLPASINGRIWKNTADAAPAPDADLYQFTARAGQTWILETAAARRGTPVDTKIEILGTNGQPVTRLLLQAVRDSAINFRPIDSAAGEARVDNWEEMELNEWLYLQGEVAKIFRMPQGPDSAVQFYTSAGKRRAYFDTTGTAHALGEACYIVQLQPPDARPSNVGLPVFPLYYANDDDGERLFGTDSRLTFAPRTDGRYIVRVTDTSGRSGEDFRYRLTIREARPDFKVTLKGNNPTVNAGSGQAFSVEVERIDGFDGEVSVDISGLPPGFTVSSPLVIQAGHREAKGTLNAAAEAPALTAENGRASKVVASAVVNGQTVMKDVNNLGQITLAAKPKLIVYLEPEPDHAGSAGAAAAATATATNSGPAHPREIVIRPGQSVPARLKVERNGHEDLITFTVDNLPHGVIVDNIGLNGVLIPKGENERQIFLNAAKWVPETTRFCYAIESQAGKQTSLPVMLKVRRGEKQVAATNP